MAMHTITVTVNGSQEYLTVPSNMTLLQMLREELALTGTKNGCEAGECGACTVLVDGEAVNSCMMLAVEADGREVTTVEGLARLYGVEDGLSPLQEAFVDHNAVQCGFCTPGMLISAHALLQRNPHPTAEEIREALVGNLCRCTGYLRIVEAVRAAAGKGAPETGAESFGAAAGRAAPETGAGSFGTGKVAPETGAESFGTTAGKDAPGTGAGSFVTGAGSFVTGAESPGKGV